MSSRLNDDATDDIRYDIEDYDDYDDYDEIEREDRVKRPRQPNKNLNSAHVTSCRATSSRVSINKKRVASKNYYCS